MIVLEHENTSKGQPPQNTHGEYSRHRQNVWLPCNSLLRVHCFGSWMHPWAHQYRVDHCIQWRMQHLADKVFVHFKQSLYHILIGLFLLSQNTTCAWSKYSNTLHMRIPSTLSMRIYKAVGYVHIDRLDCMLIGCRVLLKHDRFWNWNSPAKFAWNGL